MEIVLDEGEVNQGKRNIAILAGLRLEDGEAQRRYAIQVENALVVFNRDVSRIIKENAAV
jgi:hypothetical protein